MEKAPVIPLANPHIVIGRVPINKESHYNQQEYDENIPSLYQGFLTDRNLKLSFTVIWNSNFDNESQKTTLKSFNDFQVVKFDSIYLHGIDNNKAPDFNEKSGTLSANPEIVEALFQDVLTPYSIKLNKVTMHDYKDFESVNFTFTDEALKDKLCQLIDFTFRKNLT